MAWTGQSEVNDLLIVTLTSSLTGFVFDTFKDICKKKGLLWLSAATSW